MVSFFSLSPHHTQNENKEVTFQYHYLQTNTFALHCVYQIMYYFPMRFSVY